MSVRTKTRLTKPVRITVEGVRPRLFIVPKEKADGVAKILDEFEVEEGAEDVPSDEVFKSLYKDVGKPAVLFRALREKESLTQVQIAKKLGVEQTDISQMENGRRSIGKKLARRIAKAFKTDYRLFL